MLPHWQQASYHVNATYTHLHICLQGEVCAPSPVQAYSAIASRVFTRANYCELLISLSREPHANLSYIRLIYVMDLNVLHAILLSHLQFLLL